MKLNVDFKQTDQNATPNKSGALELRPEPVTLYSTVFELNDALIEKSPEPKSAAPTRRRKDSSGEDGLQKAKKAKAKEALQIRTTVTLEPRRTVALTFIRVFLIVY
jgi:hypothetical protein